MSGKLQRGRHARYPAGVWCAFSVSCLFFCRFSADRQGYIGERSLRVAALTRMTAGAIFVAMRRLGPVTMVVRALLLAVLGLVVTSGVALAHGNVAHGPIATERQSSDAQFTDAHSTMNPVASLDALEQVAHSGAPCSSDEQSGGHRAGGCCNVACHAALASFAAGPIATVDLSDTRVVGLTGMLEGRSSDRTERPPRRSRPRFAPVARVRS